MSIVLQLPEVHQDIADRPARCPHCGGTILQKWGQTTRSIKDTQVRAVHIQRYKCTQCQRTFRHYPQGIAQAQQSQRLQALCVVMWALGLSHRSVAGILSVFGISLSHMSGWRDVQQAGKRLRRRAGLQTARVAGIDGMWQQGQGFMVAVDMGNGRLLELAMIDEKDQAAVTRWLQLLQQEYGIEAIVTDDLSLYKGIADTLGLDHQICQFHVRRWVGKALRDLEGQLPPEWVPLLDRIRDLLHDLPEDGGQVLFDLWLQIPGRTTRPDQRRTPLEKLRDLVLRLSRDWERYRAFVDDPGIPWTNNRSEQIIGRMKSRGKRVRGYKSPEGQLHSNWVAVQYWG